ncbi:hypothetical protein AVEN_107126-1 [Araneus ventricosus]|uniref:STPR domain-containing protein n=1 Tax=Araneus ventricosus TaxID=182803 RepID=A0A4Y2QTL2_ARAVE|nr:hypothetical protein AVEN_107126-1 [Araneus ventricosus]
MPKRKRGITGDAASRREAIRKRERRVVETEEQRNSRLSDMAQRGQERRAEETEEQRKRRLAVMAQRGQERRAEETDEQINSRLAVMAQRVTEKSYSEGRWKRPEKKGNTRCNGRSQKKVSEAARNRAASLTGSNGTT